MSVTNEELLARLEALQLQADRAEAVTICANIMSRYVNYHAAFRHKEYVEFWPSATTTSSRCRGASTTASRA